MGLRIFGERPFARDQWGPRYPVTMLVLLSALMILAAFRLGQEIQHSASLKAILALALLPAWWYAYFRLHRIFVELPRPAVARIIALMTVGLLILLLSLG